MLHRVTHRVTDSPKAGATPQDNLGPLRCTATLSGANGEARTLDLLFTKQLLYQLSYIGTMRRIVAERAEAVKSSPVCYNFRLYHAAGQLPLWEIICARGVAHPLQFSYDGRTPGS
jgi:hypothetical protein